MALYAIGDIQGCLQDLHRLLDKLAFDPAVDRLWFTGDLVNRGPHSLETLRFVRGLGSAATTVLGNHDLHLLAVAARKRRPHRKDTLDAVLAAPDTEELLDWLRRQPLLHNAEGYCLIHAGLAPQWDLNTALGCAAEVERVLRSDGYTEFLEHMYGDLPNLWSPELQGWARLRFITNCFTRLRYCHEDGSIDLQHKLAPADTPHGLKPWFALPERRSRGIHVIFGHWSTLGFHVEDNTYCLDSGCLWGGQLTALRLDGALERISLECAGEQPID